MTHSLEVEFQSFNFKSLPLCQQENTGPTLYC